MKGYLNRRKLPEIKTGKIPHLSTAASPMVEKVAGKRPLHHSPAQNLKQICQRNLSGKVFNIFL